MRPSLAAKASAMHRRAASSKRSGARPRGRGSAERARRGRVFARPELAQHPGHGYARRRWMVFRSSAGVGSPKDLGKSVEDVACERLDVVQPFPQGRDANGKHAETVEGGPGGNRTVRRSSPSRSRWVAAMRPHVDALRGNPRQPVRTPSRSRALSRRPDLRSRVTNSPTSSRRSVPSCARSKTPACARSAP